MIIENRKESRSTIQPENNALFYIEIFDKKYPIEHVNDVSLTGVGIRFSQEIPRGTPVRMLCTEKDCDITIPDTVAWCEPIIDTAPTDVEQQVWFQNGIRFDTRDRNHTLFFLALRQYIDPYDKVG